MADEARSPVQFSGGEKEVIERKLNVSVDNVDAKKDINDFYEIPRCVDVIKRDSFQKVRANDQDVLSPGHQKNSGPQFFWFSDKTNRLKIRI